VLDADDGSAGRICVQSPSLAEGYTNAPEATREAFRTEGLVTADIGAVDGGHLYVLGRRDDVLVVDGRNVYPYRAEESLEADQATRPGCSALVSVVMPTGTTVLALVTELRDAAHGIAEAQRLTEVVTESSGLAVNLCVFVPAGVFPKTPSGKARRALCRMLVNQPPDGASVFWLRPAVPGREPPTVSAGVPSIPVSAVVAAVSQVLGQTRPGHGDIQADSSLERLALESIELVEIFILIEEWTGIVVNLSEAPAGAATVADLASYPTLILDH
jgi:acyl carrier protein